MPLDVLTLVFCATRNTKNTSAFDSKNNFLRIVLSSHPKRRLAPAMGKTPTQMEKKCRVISAVYCIVLWFYCHFIIERYDHCSQNVHIFQYKTAFKISMSKIVIFVEFKSRLLLAN